MLTQFFDNVAAVSGVKGVTPKSKAIHNLTIQYFFVCINMHHFQQVVGDIMQESCEVICKDGTARLLSR